MKAGALFTAVLTAIVLALTGCSKDKDEPKEYGQFTFEAKSYALHWGMLENYGSITKAGSYNFDVTLFSSGIDFDDQNETATGTGDGIHFEMYSSLSTDLATGEYVFDTEATGNPLTFDYAAFVIGYNWDEYTGQMYSITSGTVTVAKSGTEYEFTINCMSGENSVTGHYKGPIEYYDWSAFGIKIPSIFKAYN